MGNMAERWPNYTVEFSPDDANKVNRAAIACGMSRGGFMRDVILAWLEENWSMVEEKEKEQAIANKQLQDVKGKQLQSGEKAIANKQLQEKAS